jgi:CheY-like chemotaxis protein
MFREPARWWSLPELAGRAGLNATTLRQHLNQMRNAGLVLERSEGGKPWFQPDPDCPVYVDLHALITKVVPRDEQAETVMVVEDQPATAKITRILLESWGYRVLEAHSGEDAIALFHDHGDGVHLLLTDVLMPGLTGPEIADELVRRKPGLRVIFMSGYPAEHLEHRDAAFLPKPFNPAGLSRMVRRELDRARRTEKTMNGA